MEHPRLPRSDSPEPQRPASAAAAPDTSADAPPPERRLAAILAADVEGYSRMMHRDEERTLAILTSHRKIVDDLIVTARGQIFGAAGDSVLAEFPSVVEAFHGAIAVQQALEKANAALPEDERMLFRIAINVGDVMVKDGDIFGEGVNIAARLESLAEPGGICVSRNARDQLRDRVDTKFEDLGEHSVKNIPRPIKVFRVLFDRTAEPELPETVRRVEPEPEDDDIGEAPPSDSVEIAFWQSVQASDDDAEYRIYLERYPDGAFAELAQARLRGASAVEDSSVELAFWETVRTSDDPAMLSAYLEKYPQGEFRSLAAIMLKGLENKTS
jgi:class 3 adenylate cyclase